MAGSSGSQATPAKTDAVVEYVGSADEAKISANDWKKAKVEGDHKQVVWNADNEYKVPVSDLNDGALKALRRDSRFKVPGDEA
jgi:hypothetical protein